jgi:DNA-binding winged helix-turn-helix (wHTH) protein
MKPEHLFFPPFHLDLMNETLWCGARLVPLRPKALAVLRYLAEHAQRLVTQEELLKAVWQRPYVSEGLLRGYIRELREVCSGMRPRRRDSLRRPPGEGIGSSPRSPLPHPS